VGKYIVKEEEEIVCGGIRATVVHNLAAQRYLLFTFSYFSLK
jgi:hypothetical protein